MPIADALEYRPYDWARQTDGWLTSAPEVQYGRVNNGAVLIEQMSAAGGLLIRTDQMKPREGVIIDRADVTDFRRALGAKL